MHNFVKKIDGFFKVSERGSTFSKELIGGIIVFFCMLYILPVNTSILTSTGISAGAVFAATAICSGICSILMGVLANFPVALSAGMGMNAYLAFTVCGSLGYSWQEGLSVVIISGVLFFIMTMTPIRRWIIDAIPKSLKYAISAGLGAFICFVGLKMGGIITSDMSTFVALNSFDPTGGNAYVLLALGGILLVFALMAVPNKLVKKLAILIAMVVTAIAGLIMGACGLENMPSFEANTGAITDISQTFLAGFGSIGTILAKPQTYAIIFSFIFVNLFDTTATLIAVGEQVGIVDKESGKMVGGKKAMIADATGALIAGAFGTSPVTSFAESTVGVESGARTGISAMVTGLLFLLSLAIFPVFNVFAGIPVGADTFTPVSSLALVAVGALMFIHLKDIEWDDKVLVFSSFITFIMMLLTYSISNGIALGIIFYCLMMLASGKGKTLSPVLYVLGVVFIASFVITAVLDHTTSTPVIEMVNVVLPSLQTVTGRLI